MKKAHTPHGEGHGQPQHFLRWEPCRRPTTCSMGPTSKKTLFLLEKTLPCTTLRKLLRPTHAPARDVGRRVAWWRSGALLEWPGASQDVQRTPNVCCEYIFKEENAQRSPQFHEIPWNLEQKTVGRGKKKRNVGWSGFGLSTAGGSGTRVSRAKESKASNNQPTLQPTNQPTDQTTNQPTNQPASQPASQPTKQ